MATEEIKSFKRPVEIITEIQRSGWGVFSSDFKPLDGVKARLKKNAKQFLLNWKYPLYAPREITPGDYLNFLDFQFRGYVLRLQNVYIGSSQLGVVGGMKISADVGYFHTKDFSKKTPYYYRLIMVIDKKIDLLHQLQRKVFADDLGWRHSNGTEATISKDPLQVCIFHVNKEQYYLSIESSIEQPFEAFCDKAHAVINGVALLTGFLAGNAGWYFAYDHVDKKEPVHLYRNEMRDSIESFYSPINTNPSTWIRDDVEAKRLYDLKLTKPVNFEVFSALCQKLHDSIDFSSVVLLILEASVASLVFMPGGFAIALESIADLIIGDMKTDLAPMNKSLAKKVRSKLEMIIKEECAHLPKEQQDILLGKIANINQVTNKSRLRTPFDLLKIPLNDKDLQLINTRNDFLHGRIPDITGAGENRSTDQKNLDLYYAAMRFYTLLNRLILNWIGYDNYVLNHAKIQESYTKIPLDEDYYLQVRPASVAE